MRQTLLLIFCLIFAANIASAVTFEQGVQINTTNATTTFEDDFIFDEVVVQTAEIDFYNYSRWSNFTIEPSAQIDISLYDYAMESGSENYNFSVDSSETNNPTTFGLNTAISEEYYQVLKDGTIYKYVYSAASTSIVTWSESTWDTVTNFVLQKVGVVPFTISSYSNSITNDDSLYPDIPNGHSVTFEVNSLHNIVLYEWWIDGVEKTNNQNTYTTSFTKQFYHNVTVRLTNEESDTLTMSWSPIVYRGVGVTTTDTIDETPYNGLMSALEDNTDYSAFLSNAVLPFTTVIGSMFYVLIWGVYFGMVWIRQESIYVPAVVGLIVGMVLFVFLPSNFAIAGTSLLVLSASAAIFNLYKER